MCDLIDLNSPNVRGSQELTKLASPLIPAPKSVECGNEAGSKSVTEKREGEGNNPFDQVLHETAEYVSKKGDPFEVMLQRALRSKGCRSARSVDFTDDYTPRKKKYLKAINKTLSMLDESLLESGFGFYNENEKREARVTTESGGIDARIVDVCDNNGIDNASVFKQEHKISVTDPDSLELSILNQSAMNDTLLEVIPKKNGKISLSPEKDSLFKEHIFPSDIKHLKLSHVQRSLSEREAAKSSTELSCLYKRSQSVTDDRRKTSLMSSGNSTMSLLDRGFLENKQNDQSVFSSLSNVSSITKLTSTSLSSLVLSINPMNHAFMDDNSLKTSQEKMNAIESSVDIKYDLSDLAERFNKLKFSINNMTSILSITDKDDSSSTKGESNIQIANNKLIDVDAFIPEQNKNFNRSSSSTCSSDSVFTNNKVDKSILLEAKELAKTFEELALNSESSVDDDLISNNTMWMSELLPAFEDEPVVNDLIHLPTSPEEEYSRDRNNHKKQSPTSINSAEENSLKKMELSFTGASIVKQDITSLLSDLRKLVKPDSNPEAKKLLDNLESILNINYKNNTELLVTCLNTSNKSQSPQKTSLDSIERFDKSNIDKNEEESDKVSSQEKICNNEKSLTNTNCKKLKDTDKSQDKSQDVLSIEKSSVTSSSCKDESESRMNITESSDLIEDSMHKAKEGDSQVDKKIAVELLVNLKKLLSGQSEDDTTIQLLKNIGKVLNTALNNSPESKMQTKKQNIQTTPVKAQKSDNNAHLFTRSTRVAHRQSLESKSKTVRKSISAIESSPKSMQIRRRKDTSELENKQKRFSSDPGFINTPSNKKLMNQNTCNTRKAEAARPDSRKEKSIGINDVKNKLKKRSDIVNKKGPIKAVHPVDNMQRKRASIGRQMSSQITPPKSNKIISSTPTDNNHYMFKKSAKSKPIASSTPDGQNSKSAPLTTSNKKRNFSCDISPVTTYVNINDERKDSPKRMSKLPTPKKCTTPTRQQTDGIPRFLTPPRHYSSLNTNNPQSPQRLSRSSISLQRYSPLGEKKNVGKIQQSPLKEVNRITSKVKPRNLISKIKRHSISDFTEKENYYA